MLADALERLRVVVALGRYGRLVGGWFVSVRSRSRLTVYWLATPVLIGSGARGLRTILRNLLIGWLAARGSRAGLFIA
jgi:hypothetical protein